MVVLAVGAHPDDLELKCFGTLAKYVKQGHSVVTCTVANGSLGDYIRSPSELAEIRKQEATAAAKKIGATYIGLDIGDLEVDGHSPVQQRKMAELIRQVKPDVIITHSPDDYMSDHVETSNLVFYSSFASSIPNYKTETPCYDLVAAVYYMENSLGVNFLPQEYVDITEEQNLKLQAICCHHSQMDWLAEHDNQDMAHSAEVMAEFRGMQCGTKYAEAFRRLDVSGRVPCRRLLP